MHVWVSEWVCVYTNYFPGERQKRIPPKKKSSSIDSQNALMDQIGRIELNMLECL